MKRKLFTLSALTLGLVLAGCGEKEAEAAPAAPVAQTKTAAPAPEVDHSAMGHSAVNALDWSGSYTGMLPCADCESIKTTLVLNKDNTYQLTTSYTGKTDKPTVVTGKFTWNDKGNTVILDHKNSAPTHYFVGENTVTQLDMKGNKVEGKLAPMYIMKKDASTEVKPAAAVAALPIENVKWELVEFEGKPVKSDGKTPAPFLKLDSATKRIAGHGGCNNFMSQYTLTGETQISFKGIAGTMKACVGDAMAVETAFLKMLGSVDNYAVNGDSLSLHKARMAPLARFKKVN